MIEVFIDESGNLGRGGRYFVLAAAVFDTSAGVNRLKRIVRKSQLRFADEGDGRKINELKSSRLTFEQRQYILNRFTSKADLDIFYIVAYKPNVTSLTQNKPKNLVYNYLAKLLVGQILTHYNDDFHIVFDQRSTAVESRNSLADYLRIAAYTTYNRVDKNVIVTQQDSRTAYNLQAADIIAGTIYQAYKLQNHHFIDMITPRVVYGGEFPYNGFAGNLFQRRPIRP